MKILVTGSKGMVGTALCNNLKNIRDGKNCTRPNMVIDEIYEYEMRVLADTPINNGEKIYNEFRGEYYYKALDKAWKKGDSFIKEEDEFHWINESIAEEYGYEYCRRSRKK
mgnify:CR=1 FL=1